MKTVKVEGKKAKKVLMFTLSTCIWCKKTKNYLKTLGVEYEYCDMDLLQGEEREAAKKELSKWNPSLSFPTIIIDSKTAIRGFQPDEIKEKLGV
jgi:glutaredoxin-like protein NrdH